MGITAATKNKCLVIMLPDGADIQSETKREVSDEELGALTKSRTFLGYGPAPAAEAAVLVQYASYGKEGGLLPGYGSFK